METKILNEAQATLLLLEVIHEEGVLNKSGMREFQEAKAKIETDNDFSDFMEKYELPPTGNFIVQNGTTYFVAQSVFKNIINKFKAEGLIGAVHIFSYPHNVEFENIEDALKTGIELGKKFPNISTNELVSEELLFTCVIENFEKIKEELDYLKKSLGPIPAAPAEKPSSQEIKIIAYSDGILTFSNGAKIEISRSKDSKPHALLATIFKDKQKKWSFDEILEDWDSEEPSGKFDWRPMYFACRSVQNKVAVNTPIKDFLSFTSKQVRINPAYL